MYKTEQLTPLEMERLGTYNSEVARGIIHTKKWIYKMAQLQSQFNTCAKEVSPWKERNKNDSRNTS